MKLDIDQAVHTKNPKYVLSDIFSWKQQGDEIKKL